MGARTLLFWGAGCWLVKGGDHMGAQKGEDVEERVQALYASPDRWGQRHPAEMDVPSLREQRGHLRWLHPFHIRVARIVEREIVPEHEPAGAGKLPHPLRKPAFESGIQNGSE